MRAFVPIVVFGCAAACGSMAAVYATSQATQKASQATASQLAGFRAAYAAVPAEIYSKYTRGSILIDVDSIKTGQGVAALASQAAQQATPREAAISMHDYVRDGVLFGWDSGFHERTASQVIKDARGFCISKSTLFAALLRSVGIPARVVFVDIASSVLHGFLGGGRYVDHSYVEVLLPHEGGAEGDFIWLAVDSFVVDAPLFDVAMRRVRAEGRRMGYGVHAAGTREWDGRRDAFSQFVAANGTGRVTYGEGLPAADVVPTRARFRLHEFPHITSREVTPVLSDDAKRFYDDANEGGILPPHLPRVPMRGLLKVFFGLIVWPANNAVEALRAEASDSR